MKIFKPLQLGFNQQTLEQDRRFHFVGSVTMGIQLSTGESLLETEYFKDAIQHMGSQPLPDVGMPKPRGEYLASGSYYSPGAKEVTGGEVKVMIGDQAKSLFVFGPRSWEGGIPSAPARISSMPVEYRYAYGGDGLVANPSGIGYKDGKLPCIENPDQLVSSPGAALEPAGFSTLDPSWPQRSRFQGTYDDNYLQNYFPGYPPDFDWNFFLTAPEDQWNEGYYQGDERFRIYNMHPDIPEIEGQLPGFYARCFVKYSDTGASTQFAELPLNLDTVWFFPEVDLALLIWRGGTSIQDDDAEEISNVLLAFENRKDPERDIEYYRQALEKRVNSDDMLLNNFNTADLIPVGAKCAMELLQEDAQSATGKTAFEENMNAKIETTNALIREKTDQIISEAKAGADGIPDENKIAQMDELEKMLNNPSARAGDTDPDVIALKEKLEALLPGITSGDPKKIQLKHFSFDKIDKIMAAVRSLTEKKSAQALDTIENASRQLKDDIASSEKDLDVNAKGNEQLKASLQTIESLQSGKDRHQSPVPRMNADAIAAKLSELRPDTTEAMQQLQMMKAAGIDNEQTRAMEKMISESLDGQDLKLQEGLKQAESAFRETYFTGAHFMETGLSPHQQPVEEIRERFLQKLSGRETLDGGDWACIDLAGQVLDNADLSDCYLEQVDFTGASLKNANLSGAILARAILNDADLSGASLEGTNLGNVKAHRANFSAATIRNAKLSRSDFTAAIFPGARIEHVESLEIIINQADFTDAIMPAFQFLQMEIDGAVFNRASLADAVFLQTGLKDAQFIEADMPGCIWADVRLRNIRFDKANMPRNCFAATEPEKTTLDRLSFRGACVDRCNFQNMVMTGSDFSACSMDNAVFSGADLTRSKFNGAYARQAQFRKSTLRNSDMSEINLMEGSLAKARISGASLTRANLYAVDFLRAVTGETDFTGSNLDMTLLQDWQPS